MKIAQIAPVNIKIPPDKYGGTERVISALTEELVKRGHQVTLFASGDSQTSAKLVSICPRELPPRVIYEEKDKVYDIYEHTAWNVMNIALAYRMQDQFDVIHDHTAQNFPMSLALANVAKKPVVITLHGAFTKSTIALYTFFKNPYYVSISHAQSQFAPNINYIGNVYHGLNMVHYPFSANPDSYLLYVGRISPEKGVHHAIHVAKRIGRPLIIAGGQDMNYKNYISTAIQPHLSKMIRWIGEVDESTRNELMSKAYCTLHPITWPEPFGLTIIESMACGSPVVGFSIGSIPELIQNGKTGFVVNSVSEMVEAVKKIPSIDRSYCRSYALKRFTVEKMVDEYEKIYIKAQKQHSSFIRIPPVASYRSQKQLSIDFLPDFS